jgi:pentachlorophenol monooxygenase
VHAYVIAHADAETPPTTLPVIRDAAGEFAEGYGARDGAAFVVRPDGYVGFASSDGTSTTAEDVATYLGNTFA